MRSLFIQSQASQLGGAIYVRSSKILLFDCIMDSNTCVAPSSALAIKLFLTPSQLQRCRGGSIASIHSDVIITGGISFNSAAPNGGFIWSTCEGPRPIKCYLTIESHTAYNHSTNHRSFQPDDTTIDHDMIGYGGLVAATNGVTGNISKCLIASCYAYVGGVGALIDVPLLLKENVFIQNTAAAMSAVLYVDTEKQPDPTTGVYPVKWPKFVLTIIGTDSNIFHRNYCAFGINEQLVTLPFRLNITSNTSDIIQSSGQSVQPPLQAQLFDFWGRK
jgi:predicted outer membrane repeat protein